MKQIDERPSPDEIIAFLFLSGWWTDTPFSILTGNNPVWLKVINERAIEISKKYQTTPIGNIWWTLDEAYEYETNNY